MAAFAPTLKLAQMAWRCAGVIFGSPLISYQRALPKVLGPQALHCYTKQDLLCLAGVCIETPGLGELAPQHSADCICASTLL